MSDLQKSFAKSKLAKLPPEPPPILDETAEENEHESTPASTETHEHDDDSSSASSVSSTGTVVPSASQQLFARSGRECVLFFFPAHFIMHI